jgi:Rieske Fe-S protein
MNNNNGKSCSGGCENCSCSSESNGKSRRTFLGVIVGVINVGILGAIAGPVLGFLGSPLKHKVKREWIPIAQIDVVPPMSAKEVTYTIRTVDGYHEVERSYSVFLRRDGENVVCIDPACTHLGCRVTYQESKDRFLCPCHGGVFDKDGNVVSGPPPKHLDKHQVKVESGQIWLLREV